MRGQSIKQLVESNGIEWTCHQIDEAMELGRRPGPERRDGLRPDDFSFRELAEAFCGHEWVQRLNPRRTGRFQNMGLLEAGEGVDVSAFSNITGQIMFNKILEGWELASMIGDKIADDENTDLDGEKEPFLSRPLTEGEEVHPGMPFEEAGLSEEYIETPRLAKFGRILSVTKEAVFFDRTGQMLRQAGKMGEQLKMNKERRILNLFIGAPNSAPFKWKGVSYAPYAVAGANTYWTNSKGGLPLVDWTSIEVVEIMATRILEPDLQNVGINSPIEINLDTLIVTPFKKHTARRTAHATEVRSNDLAAAPTQQTISGNPLDAYEIIDSKILYRQLIDQGGLTAAQAQDVWFMLDSKRKPIVYKQNWPLRVIQAPPNNTSEFERDIVYRVRADERGNPGWRDPRYAYKLFNT